MPGVVQKRDVKPSKQSHPEDWQEIEAGHGQPPPMHQYEWSPPYDVVLRTRKVEKVSTRKHIHPA